MCDMGRQNQELMRKANLNEVKAKTALEKVQTQFLKRGAAGIKGAQRRFRIMDNNRDRMLSKDEFFYGLDDIGLRLTDRDKLELFHQFDRDGQGTIDFDEFLINIQPPMNAKRRRLVQAAFAKMDKDKSKVITWEEVAKTYKVHKHPKFISGEWKEEDVLREFLKTFEAGEHRDGNVTLDEFMSYYASISCSIDDDAYFDLMMKNSWGDDL